MRLKWDVGVRGRVRVGVLFGASLLVFSRCIFLHGRGLEKLSLLWDIVLGQ